MSRRLGRNKAVEKIGGESLIERVVGRLSQVSSETIVVVAEESRAQALDLPPWVRTAADIYPDSGSLGGIFTGLSAAKGRLRNRGCLRHALPEHRPAPLHAGHRLRL